MGIVNSNVATRQQPYSTVKNMPPDCGGRVRIAAGSYLPAGNEVAGTVINLAKLPKGARLLPSSKLYFAAGQNAALTVKVGDAAKSDRYFAAAAPGAAAAVVPLAANAHGNDVLAEEGFVFITTGAQTLTASAISFELYYVID